MTRTKVVKLLYLADLRSVAVSGMARSGVLWRWWHYGPYCQSLKSVEDSLVGEGAVERESWRLSAYVTEYRLFARSDAATVLMRRGDEFLEHLGAVLEEHGHKNAKALTDVAYGDLTHVGPDGLPDADEIIGTFRGNRAYANSLLLG